MILKSFGCSFIFGSDLKDDGRREKRATPSQHTWPALIAKNLGYDYECHARPGSGNLQILEKLLNQLAVGNMDFCVIGWTWIDRFDYTDPSDDHWKTILPHNDDKVAEFYFKNLHSQYRDKLVSLHCISTAVQELQKNKIPFFMTYMDDLIFETRWHNSPAMGELQKIIRDHVYNFNGKNFLRWAADEGFPISATGHPLEQAHRIAARFMKNKIDSIYKGVL